MMITTNKPFDQLKASIISLEPNKKGALASMFGSFFHYQPVSQSPDQSTSKTFDDNSGQHLK